MTGLSVSPLVSLLVPTFCYLWNVCIHTGLVVEAISSAEVEQHLELGKKLLAAGQLSDALSHYHAAVEGDPNNYLTYYKRATVYLALGKSRSALPDLDRVIQLKPDFVSARLQRGSVLLKQGQLDDAKKDFDEAISRDPGNVEALEKSTMIVPLKEDIEYARLLYAGGEYHKAIEVLSRIIEVVLWDPELKEIRAECYIAQGDLIKAIGDIRPTTKLRPDNTAAYLKLSFLHYQMGEADESLIQIRECLKLDPDHKDCFQHYKKVKKLVKQLQSAQDLSNEQQYEECVNKARQIMQTEPSHTTYLLRAHTHQCHCLVEGGHPVEGLKECQTVLQYDPNSIYALMDSAEAHIQLEEFDEAINKYQQAHSLDEGNRQAREGIHKAQKLLKQSKKRDYYKILGVKRNAKKKEILKAYRKLAVKWHPDKYEGDDKQKAQKMFIDIASAKEVLTDPEKRQQYDNGEDPLDPEAQQGQPWQHGFNPFGSSGFSFKFNFN